MLGPVDLDAWLDEEAEKDLGARLRSRPEIDLVGRDASLVSLPGWTPLDFALARRLCRTGYLDPHELHQLAERLGV